MIKSKLSCEADISYDPFNIYLYKSKTSNRDYFELYLQYLSTKTISISMLRLGSVFRIAF